MGNIALAAILIVASTAIWDSQLSRVERYVGDVLIKRVAKAVAKAAAEAARKTQAHSNGSGDTSGDKETQTIPEVNL